MTAPDDDPAPPPSYDWRLLRRLLGYLRPNGRAVGAAFALIGPALVVGPEGAAQVALIGPPNSGKSSLHARLTHRARASRPTRSRRSIQSPA